ncbi:hypothetical protein BGZ63DRAFT_419933 [Mariannaea sp. PMI_226]|nr:hypothetical protein BGZ63DRAFT_419933 [Mariannaea sp. PMI_226]
MKFTDFGFLFAGLPLALALPALAPSGDVKMVTREAGSEGQSKPLHVRDSLITKRDVTFPWGRHPVAFNGDQCGDSSFEITDDVNAQPSNIDDCNALSEGLRDLNEHWELNNGFGGTAVRWLELASVGSCHFFVDRSGFLEAVGDANNFIGTTDLSDLVRDSTANFQHWGTVTWGGGSTSVGYVLPVTGNMGCFPNNWNTPWRIQANQP